MRIKEGQSPGSDDEMAARGPVVRIKEGQSPSSDDEMAARGLVVTMKWRPEA